MLTSEHLWTAKEAAAYLRVNVRFVYRLVKIPRKNGGPPIIKLGSRKKPSLRFPRDDFIRWTEQRST